MSATSEPLSDAVGRGVFAARPAAGIAGRLYIATDTAFIYRDNGSSWDLVVTGTPTAIWVPVMVQDVSSGLWYVAVTGGGDAVMTEVPL